MREDISSTLQCYQHKRFSRLLNFSVGCVSNVPKKRIWKTIPKSLFLAAATHMLMPQSAALFTMSSIGALIQIVVSSDNNIAIMRGVVHVALFHFQCTQGSVSPNQPLLRSISEATASR
jgi:hypothetical protein